MRKTKGAPMLYGWQESRVGNFIEHHPAGTIVTAIGEAGIAGSLLGAKGAVEHVLGVGFLLGSFLTVSIGVSAVEVNARGLELERMHEQSGSSEPLA